jgi:hypothetical protein
VTDNLLYYGDNLDVLRRERLGYEAGVVFHLTPV